VKEYKKLVAQQFRSDDFDISQFDENGAQFD
jgi:hypothetical protein